MKKLCVFDLDGTIVNSLPDISAAMTAALTELDLPAFSVAEYRRKVGNGARVLCRRCLPEGREDLLEPLLKRYDDLYIHHCAERTVPFAGMPELLRALHDHGVLTAVISNKPHAQTLEVVAHVLPGVPFDLVFGQREGVPLKPAPDALREVLRALRTAPGDVLYVGDSPVDIQFGQAAEVETCAVTWGYRDRAELEAAHPDCVADTPDEVLRRALR